MRFKLTISIILTILLLGGGIYETIFIQKTFTKFNEKIDVLLAQEEYDLDYAIEIQKWWIKKQPQICITVTHAQINEINFTYNEFIGAVEAKDYQSSRALLQRISEYSDTLRQTYKFKIINII